jgi:hypothetical protein
MHRITTAVTLAVLAVLTLASVALGQDTGPVDEPTVGLLASAAGLSGVIFIITNLLRGVIDPVAFDKWAPLIAVAIGILLAELYAIAVDQNTTGEAIIQAALVGLFAGGFSQNVNTMFTRATRPA